VRQPGLATIRTRLQQAWLRSVAATEQWFRGQRGGLDPVETGTYLACLSS
jgi:hypothetical protein